MIKLATYLAVGGVVCLVALSDLRPVIVANQAVAASMAAETATLDDLQIATVRNDPDAGAALAAASNAGARPYLEH